MNLSRSVKPIPNKNASFTLPLIERFRLQNGLGVFFIQMKKLPIIRLSLIVNAGSKFDPKDKKGLSNLLAMVIDEGAGKYSALEISEEFDTIGANFSVNSNHDKIYFTLQTLTENFDKALELFSSVVTAPHFSDEDFLRQKRKTLTHLLQLKDDPEEIADTVFSYVIFGEKNPYAFPTSGYDDHIENISVDDIKEQYKKFLTPNNSTLVIVGDASVKGLIDKLELYFGFWKQKENHFKLSFNTRKEVNQVFLVDKKDSVQTEIRIGYPASRRNNKDFFSKLVLNTILGGPFTSRINLNLRENKGYTYGASSSFGYLQESGFFIVSTSVGIENTANAINEILNELNKIKEGITSTELEFAKSFLIRQFPSNFETYRQITSNLTTMVIHSLPENYFNSYLESLQKISIEDVNKAAQENIFTNNLSIVIVGDKEKLQPQLTISDFGNIIATDYIGKQTIK
ncbi:MAG: M16 family metallopeptidase [Ignavibacteriaceae bacterium]